MSHATWRSPTAWTGGTLIAVSAARRTRRARRTIQPPPTASPRSCPRPCLSPAGSAALVQSIFADDYRGAMVIFRGEIRTEPLTEQAGLRLEILRHWWRNGRAREDHGVTVSGGHDWTRHEITALIPEDADIIRFGIALAGPGRIALRNPELRTAEPRAAESASGT